MKKHICITAMVLLAAGQAGAQGIINNGAFIVMSGASRIYIDGGNNGDYLRQANGRITPSATGQIDMEGDWTNNAGNTGFTADAGTVRFVGTAQTINGTSSTTFYNLDCQNTTSVTQNVATSVGGVTTTTGVLNIGLIQYNLNSFRLTITNPAAAGLSYFTGYILSETNVASNPSIVRWNIGANTGARVIPFGTLTAGIPLTVNTTAAMPAVTDYFEVATRATAASNNLPWTTGVTHMYDPNLAQDGSDEAVIDRWWDFRYSSASTATITFFYRGIENTMIAPYQTGNIGAQYWSAAWLPNNANIGSAAAVTAGVGSVTAAGIPFAAAALTPMVLSSLGAPLPVELVSFEAGCDNSHALLSWATASESNNSHFDVERSEDGFVWNTAGTVYSQAPNGNSSSMLHYQFSDPQALNGTTYYRLRQVDFNGLATTQQSIAPVQPCDGNSGSVNVYNDGTNQLQLQINAPYDGDYVINIIDARGRLVHAENVSAEEGYNSYRLQVKFPATGVYLVSVTGAQQVVSKRLYITQ